VLVPASGITTIDERGRTVEVRLPNGETPTPYRADADVLTEMHDALWNYARLRVDLRAVEMRVIDGEAWLRGHVSSTLNRRVISDLVLNIPGLHETHNELVADNDLAVTIARALAKDPRTHGQMIGVYPNLGRVFLRGRAHSPEVALIATQVAAEASGQAEVINQLGIDPAATLIPALSPVTGTDDIVPGGD
nr:BON domain-containing protein [Ktedonobacterales bacterium]